MNERHLDPPEPQEPPKCPHCGGYGEQQDHLDPTPEWMCTELTCGLEWDEPPEEDRVSDMLLDPTQWG